MYVTPPVSKGHLSDKDRIVWLSLLRLGGGLLYTRAIIMRRCNYKVSCVWIAHLSHVNINTCIMCMFQSKYMYTCICLRVRKPRGFSLFNLLNFGKDLNFFYNDHLYVLCNKMLKLEFVLPSVSLKPMLSCL